MESLQLRSGVCLPASLTQAFPCCRPTCATQGQAFSRSRRSWRNLRTRHSVGAVLVTARRRNEGDGDGILLEEDVGGVQQRTPLWQRAWGLGARALGVGETWKEDPKGRQELEELDSFLEGRGVDFRWKDVLDPSAENVLALVLTGLLLYAVALIGWQLLLVISAVILSALKYAVIAAVLLGVLIFFV